MTQFIEHSHVGCIQPIYLQSVSINMLKVNFPNEKRIRKKSNFLYNNSLKSLKTRYIETPSLCFISNKQPNKNSKQKPLYYLYKSNAFVWR